jgi:hypothetical protein
LKGPAIRPGQTTTPGLSENTILSLMTLMSQCDGVMYTTFTCLNFSRPAVCIKADSGEQKIVSVETAKQLLKGVPVNEKN